MILYVNGIRKDATASLDLLTRAVVISLLPGAGRSGMTGPHSHTAGGGHRLLFRMTASVPASTC